MAKKPIRKFANINQIIKMIHDQPNNWWATVCYAKLIKVRKTMRTLDKDSFGNHLNTSRAETNDDIYNGLSDFHSGISKKLPYVAVFAIKRYQFNWIAGERWDEKNKKYKEGLGNISRKSLSSILPRKIENPGEADFRNYMPNTEDSETYGSLTYGLGSKIGTTGNSKGKSYIPYNRHSYKTLDIEYYGVNEEGRIVGRIPTNIGYMLDQDYDQYTLQKKPKSVDGISGIRAAGGTPDEIKNYENECNKLISNLKFLPAKIIEGQVLYMAAAVQKESTNGRLEDSGTENEKLVWLNDAITSHFESFNQKSGKYDYNFDIEPADLYKIAIEKIDNSYEMQLSSRKRFGKVIKERRQLRLTEAELKQVIKEAAIKLITEMAIDPVAKVQQLIQQANDAYRQTVDVQGETEWPLMDKEGNPYGLSGEIKLNGRGYIIIPFNGGSYSPYSPEKIKVFTKAGGRIRLYPGDYMNNGWKDAAKMLKQIINDAKIGNGHFQNYDPNWESADTPEEYKTNKAALRNMNKQIGRKASAGMDYVGKNY